MGVFVQKGKSDNRDKVGSLRYYLNRIGASALFSGAAIGVSHVVQATRAGGDYGFTLVPFILICLFLKYPTFLIGALYSQVTGESVVSGYARINKNILLLVGLSFLSVMFTVVAAVSMLASGIFLEALQVNISAFYFSIGLIISSTLAVSYFSFSTLQNYMKYVFLLLTVLTFCVLLVSLPQLKENLFSTNLFNFSFTRKDIFFIVALIGWMPAGLDLPMMHSQWVLENRSINNNYKVIQDFNFGYLSTAILAFTFLFIGIIFFFGHSIEFSSSSVGFSKQLLNVYREAIGDFIGIPVGITLFLAIFSTLIVVVDGFPRVLSEVVNQWRKKEGELKTSSRKLRIQCLWLQAFGAIGILLVFVSSLTGLVDFATTVSFLISPVFVFLNHKLISIGNLTFGSIKKTSFFCRWSMLGVISFSIFTLFYLVLRFFY